MGGVVIEAKMIDALLSDRPAIRRDLFEEAARRRADIRDRRRTTERRLEETAVDRQRLDDLIAESRARFRSLSRSAKARRAPHYRVHGARFTVEICLRNARPRPWSDGARGRSRARVVALRSPAPILNKPMRETAEAQPGMKRTQIAPGPRRSG